MTRILTALSNYHAAVLVSYAFVVIGIVLVRSWKRNSLDHQSEQPCILAFVVVSVISLLVARTPVVFVNGLSNLDEAQMIASAVKFSTDPNSWESVDTTTSGPINSYALLWLMLFGKGPSFVAARLTQIGFLSFAWLLFLFGINATIPAARIVIAATLLLFLAGATSSDFLHYSSETVSILLLMAAVFIVFRQIDGATRRSAIAISGVILGLVPYAKIQAALIAVFVGITQCLITMLYEIPGRRLRSIASLGLGAVIPTIFILLGPLAFTGDLWDFWKTYIISSLSYIQPSLGLVQIWGITAHDPLIRRYLLGMLVVAVVGAILGAVRVFRYDKSRLLKLGIAAIFLTVSIYAVARPGRPFTHYIWLLIFPVALVPASIWAPSRAEVRVRPAIQRGFGIIFAACVILFVTGIANIRAIANTLIGALGPIGTPSYRLDVTAAEAIFSAGDLYGISPAQRHRMFIWGWMPEFYVFSNVTPATRDIVTHNQIWDRPLRDYFRSRLTSELNKRPPEYIVDAVAPGSFCFCGFPGAMREEAITEGISSFPTLNDFVHQKYVLVSKSPHGAECPRIYALKTFAAMMENQFLAITNINSSGYLKTSVASFTADHVADGVLFETCPDRWLLPDGSLGELTFDLQSPQKIVSVEILNTRNGSEGDRATVRARIELRGDKEEYIQEARILRYPYWTEIGVPDRFGPVHSIKIEILQFAGRGGGLNEVRVRATPR